MCMGRGRNDKIITSWDLAMLILLTEKCDSLLSSSNNAALSAVHRVCLTKCSRNLKKSSEFIKPNWLANPMHPFRPLAMKYSQYFFLGNTNIGGIIFLVAFTAIATVAIISHSADVNEPTCFTPFHAMILSGHCTVVMVDIVDIIAIKFVVVIHHLF